MITSLAIDTLLAMSMLPELFSQPMNALPSMLPAVTKYSIATPRSLPSLTLSGAPLGPVPNTIIGSSTRRSLMLI